MGAMTCGWDPSQFAILDKVFVEPGTRTPTSCKATVYVKTSTPINFTLQMINADDWSYIGSTSIQFAIPIPPPPPTWSLVTVTNTYGCSRAINVRIGITGSNIGIAAPFALIDDVEIDWFY